MARILDDLQFAARIWKKNPAFAATGALTLALGIALNTITFGFVNALWFRPVSLHDDTRLAVLTARNDQRNTTFLFSYPNYRDLRDSAKSLEGLAAFEERSFQFQAGPGEPKLVRGGLISDGGLDLLGPAHLLGRRLGSNPSAREVLISERLWRRDFAADPSVLGREIFLDGAPATIVGVTSVRFRYIYGGYDIVGRLTPSAVLEDRDNRAVQLVARLKTGIPMTQAEAELKSISQGLAREYPASNAGYEVRPVLYRDFVFAQARKMYPLLMAGSALLLLIVCANLSNLLLAKVAARRREIALRLALGSSRAGIVRQLVTEGAALGLAGGLLGLLLVIWTRWWVVSRYPELSDLAIDFRVFAFTAAVSLLAGVLFGLAPAWSSSSPDLHVALKAGGRGSAGTRTPALRRILAVAQMALALTLMAGTGLLLRSAWNARLTDPGFNPRNLVTTDLTLPPSRYPDPARQAAFARQLVSRLQALPGVESASASTQLPLLGGAPPVRLDSEDRPASDDKSSVYASMISVSPEYNSTFRIRILAGRDFTTRDQAAAQPVVLINDTLARRLWPQRSSIGKHIRVNGGPWLQVVGVTANARQVLTQPAVPEIMAPLDQTPRASFFIALRTTAAPGSVSEMLRRTVRDLDPTLPFAALRTMDEIIADYFPRVMIFGLGLFAVLALALAALGLYGVISFLVTQRTQEIGVRIALGAARASVLCLVLTQGLRFALVGTLAGWAGALGLGRLLSSFLLDVSPADPPVLAGVTVFLVSVAVLASFQPAWRAARLDPLSALRDE